MHYPVLIVVIPLNRKITKMNIYVALNATQESFILSNNVLVVEHRFKAGEALVEEGESGQKEMEDKIASFLRDDKLFDALNLYRNENHQEFKPSMDYIHEVARKYNIEIEQNKGCSILLIFVIVSSVTILLC